MTRDAEDDDHTAFMTFEGLRAPDSDEDVVLSRAAFQLHGFGMRNSIKDGEPGFVSDDYLNAISAETSITATELSVAGIWVRVDDGYEILDEEMIEMSFNATIRSRRYEQCEGQLGGHRVDTEDARLCGHCGCRMDIDDA